MEFQVTRNENLAKCQSSQPSIVTILECDKVQDPGWPVAGGCACSVLPDDSGGKFSVFDWLGGVCPSCLFLGAGSSVLKLFHLALTHTTITFHLSLTHATTTSMPGAHTSIHGS